MLVFVLGPLIGLQLALVVLAGLNGLFVGMFVHASCCEIGWECRLAVL